MNNTSNTARDATGAAGAEAGANGQAGSNGKHKAEDKGQARPKYTPYPPPRGDKADVRLTAQWAWDAGLWPVWISSPKDQCNSPGKKPNKREWGKVREDRKWWNWAMKTKPDANLGLKLGVDGGIVDLDVDDPVLAAPVLARIFPDGLPDGLGWENDPGRIHKLFLWDDRFARYNTPIIKGWIDKETGKVKGNPNYLGIEIRIGSATCEGKQYQTVIPPSVTVGGRRREWNGHDVILPAPESLFRDLDAHALSYDRAEVLEAIGTRCVGIARDCGLRLAAAGPNEDGWWDCHAIDRPDNNPSAGINERTGVYHDFVCEGETDLSFFDLLSALKPALYPDWQTAVNRLGAEFRVRPSAKRKAARNGQAHHTEPAAPPLDVAAIRAKVDDLIAKKQVVSLFEDDTLLAALARLEVEHERDFTIISMKLGETRGFPRKRFTDLLKSIRSQARADAAPADDQGEDIGEPVCPAGQEDNPHRLARRFLNGRHLSWGEPTLRYWQGEFHAWHRGAFHPFPDKEIRGVLAGFVADEFQAIHSQEMMRWKMGKVSGDAPPRLIPVTTKLIGDVTQALSGLTLLKKEDHPRQPTWLCDDPPWPAHEVLPTRNVLVHLPSYVDEQPCTRPLTPNFFTPFALDYDFDAHAPDPVNWLTFLDQVWPDDPQSIETLQEWYGLNLVLDISYQKILAMIGVKRSGKGTIARMLKRTVGVANVVNPKLLSLATNFGLAPLIGKPTAIITDARLSGRVDQSAIVENLLSISGEDDQTIDRKHREAWTGKLPTRFTLISNELPRLADASGTLPSRFILLRFTRSFYGQEDRELEQKLIPELPGILLWAIAGWNRLRKRGHFEQPDVGKELMGQLQDLASPINGFIEERCELGPGNLATVKELFAAWREYCHERNRRAEGDEASFGRDMHAAIPNLKTTQPRNKDDGSRARCYEGIRLKAKENRPASPLAHWLYGYLRRGSATQEATLRDAAACGFTNPKEVQIAATSLNLRRFYDEGGYDCWELDSVPF